MTYNNIHASMAQEMRKQFDYILCDSPAGIESGAKHAMYFADDAIIVTNPELSSCRQVYVTSSTTLIILRISTDG